jgi:hypothetical protein
VPYVSTRGAIVARTAFFAAICLVGWAARASLGQDPGKEPAAPALAAPDSIPQAKPTSDQVPPDVNAAPAGLPGGSPSDTLPPMPPTETLPKPEPSASKPPAPAMDPELAAAPADHRSISDQDDPEKAAVAFVEQNQKMAESQLKNLIAEQTRLRERLQKVDAGIKRWETLLSALKQSQGSVANAIPGNSAVWKQSAPAGREEVPQDLSPVDPLPKSKTVRTKE